MCFDTFVSFQLTYLKCLEQPKNTVKINVRVRKLKIVRNFLCDSTYAMLSYFMIQIIHQK